MAPSCFPLLNLLLQKFGMGSNDKAQYEDLDVRIFTLITKDLEGLNDAVNVQKGDDEDLDEDYDDDQEGDVEEDGDDSIRVKRNDDDNQAEEEELVFYDPIMLTRIEEGEPIYIFERPNGTKVVFRLQTLIDYMLATGNFHDPETRIEFSDKELMEMELVARKTRLGKKQLLKAKKDSKKYKEAKIREDGLLGLERCCGELIAEMVNLIENASSHEEGMGALQNDIFPNVSHYFNQMVQQDVVYASQCLQQYIVFVKGPPNKPVKDNHGLQETCLNFLRGLG